MSDNNVETTIGGNGTDKMDGVNAIVPDISEIFVDDEIKVGGTLRGRVTLIAVEFVVLVALAYLLSVGFQARANSHVDAGIGGFMVVGILFVSALIITIFMIIDKNVWASIFMGLLTIWFVYIGLAMGVGCEYCDSDRYGNIQEYSSEMFWC